MVEKSFVGICIVFFIFISLYEAAIARNVWPATLTIEIHSKSKVEIIDFQSEDIKKIGINDRCKETRVELIIASDYHALLENLTKENIGKKIIIRIEDDILFSGTVFDPLKNGTMSFSCVSENDARAIIKKMGRNPDYHLKCTTEELETSKSYTKPMNPWAEKAIEAHSDQDLINAEKFAKKAIAGEPNIPLHQQILSAIYYAQGKKQLALEQLLKAEGLSKKENLEKFPGIYLSIADLYTEFCEYENAIKYFKKVLSSYDSNVLAHIGLAKIYEKTGQYRLAIKEYILLSEVEDEYAHKEGLEGIRRLKSMR